MVNDGQVNSTASTVTITASVANVAPVANAGTAQNVTTGTLVTLNGSASSDANSDPLTYSWTLTSAPVGSSANLINATSAAPTYTADVAGTYVASLVVNDGQVSSAASTVTITATSSTITAAQLFSKLAAGNTWTSLDTYGDGSTATFTRNVVSSSAGVATMSGATGITIYTLHFDSTGALIYTSNAGAVETIFPASATVGTTWTKPSYGTGYTVVTAKVIALNVTRTVPAGTFTDCVQVQYDYTYTDPTTGAVTSNRDTDYISPTVGRYVETVWLVNGANNGSRKLQPGYIANPTLAVPIR